MPLDYRNRSYLLENHPQIAEAFDDVIKHIQTTQEQTNVSPDGQMEPPPAPSGLQVTAAHGVFEAKIDDPNPVNRGINYFLEYSKSPSFNKPTTIDLGTSRNYRGFLGNQALHWRAHSSYPTSPRSAHVYHGTATAPHRVEGGGALTGPELLPSSGSGTSMGASGSDGGFGNNKFRGFVRPTR